MTVLNALSDWRPHIQKIGAELGPILEDLNVKAGGHMVTHGQCAMWGGLFTHTDPEQRAKASLDLIKKRCADKRLLPYFVPVGGFMLTPRYDDDPVELAAAVKERPAALWRLCRRWGGTRRTYSRPSSPSPAMCQPFAACSAQRR